MRTILTGLLVTAALAGTSGAQSLHVDATSLLADHELLGRPLAGVSVSARPKGREMLRLSLDFVRGRADRTGSTCSGLIPPGGCPAEPLNDRSSLVTGGVGWDFRTLTAGRFSLLPTGDVRLAFLSVTTRGETSGDEIEASKRMLDLRAGGRLRWSPSTRFAIQVGADVGLMAPLTATQVIDGYTPLEDDFPFRRISIGGIWTRRP